MRALWAPRTSFFYRVARPAQRLLQGSVARPCPYVFAADLNDITVPVYQSYVSCLIAVSRLALDFPAAAIAASKIYCCHLVSPSVVNHS